MDRWFGFRLKMQSAAVSRPIFSVLRIVENGDDVVFRNNGRATKNLAASHDTHVKRKHGVYTLRTWLRTKPEAKNEHDVAIAAADFARQE